MIKIIWENNNGILIFYYYYRLIKSFVPINREIIIDYFRSFN
jgi:hypothetical protein